MVLLTLCSHRPPLAALDFRADVKYCNSSSPPYLNTLQPLSLHVFSHVLTSKPTVTIHIRLGYRACKSLIRSTLSGIWLLVVGT